MFTEVLFTIDKIWQESKCPSIDEYIKVPWHNYTMEYYLAVKKKEILPFATAWMDLDSIMISETSPSEKDK